jgi:hypothetical protein
VKLGTPATVKLLLDADHSFRVGVCTGRKDADVRAEMLCSYEGSRRRSSAVDGCDLCREALKYEMLLSWDMIGNADAGI